MNKIILITLLLFQFNILSSNTKEFNIINKDLTTINIKIRNNRKKINRLKKLLKKADATDMIKPLLNRKLLLKKINLKKLLKLRKQIYNNGDQLKNKS